MALAALRERLTFDVDPVRKVVAGCLLAAGALLHLCRFDRKAWSLLTMVHRSAFSPTAARLVERFIGVQLRSVRQGGAPRARRLLTAHIEGVRRERATDKFFRDPRTLLGTRAIVLKSPGENERGVLLLGYSYIFPVFARLFDLAKVARRYHIVLEPSWSGYCALDILCYCGHGGPVFVESNEPRDTAFLRSIDTNFLHVPLGDNCWVDHRIFRPLPHVKKDADVIMVAAWATYKRHWALFAALGRLRRRGRRLRVILVGYRVDRTRDDIVGEARQFGVDDQIEIHEGVGPERVNELLNRAKVHVLWARKEGVNRGTVEAMFAGTPCILREGFNFGHRYPHVNPSTGGYATESTLPDALMSAIEHHASFSPRDWVMTNMSCQRSTAVLGDVIRNHAMTTGERWTRDLAVKTVLVNTMRYWNPQDETGFEPDYRFLMSCAKV